LEAFTNFQHSGVTFFMGTGQDRRSKRFQFQVNATCLIWKTMMVAVSKFGVGLRGTMGLVVKAAVGQTPTETLVEEGKQQIDLRCLWA